MEFELLNELNDMGEPLDERVIYDISKVFIPKKVRHWLTRVVHKDTYPKILKLQRTIMKSEGLGPNLALIKAAGVYGVGAREITAVMDKERRYA